MATFSQEVRDQLSGIPVKPVHCRRAELAALIGQMGSFALPSRGVIFLVLQSDSFAAVRRADFLLRSLSGTQPEVTALRSRQWKEPLYTLIVREQEPLRRLLTETGFLTAGGALREAEARVPARLLERECCRRAWLRGLFLAAGSVSDPHRSYHMEWTPGSEERCAQLREILAGFGLEAGVTDRRGNPAVYLKKAEAVSDALSLMGAFRSRLELEDIRILRGVRGDVNRQVNCETANLKKIAGAGADQIGAIRKIDAGPGLLSLPDTLREIAVLRLENPDASLEELGQMADPPLGKSGVNHRLRRLKQIAETLG